MKKSNNKKNNSYGTREWSTKTVNCCTGCSHNCRYCYAKYDAVKRHKRLRWDDWENEMVRQRDVDKGYRYHQGTIMFPSSHDITENNFQACFIVLEKLLRAGNRVLCVSKPHLSCIREICDHLKDYQDKILFRFSIGAFDNQILSFWEPGAPSYEERKECLKYAFDNGYATSVSIEPMLDSDHIFELVDDLSPYITDSIWIGKMNQPRSRVDITDDVVEAAVAKIQAGQTDERIVEIYEALKTNPIIKWKESIKKVVDLKLADLPGLDE
jgi:DNA repair photolyase